jgi:hypothetical protein
VEEGDLGRRYAEEKEDQEDQEDLVMQVILVEKGGSVRLQEVMEDPVLANLEDVSEWH